MSEKEQKKARWFCKSCNQWHNGYPPNCPKFKGQKKECKCGGEIRPTIDFYKQDGEEKFERVKKDAMKEFGLDFAKVMGYNCIKCGLCFDENMKEMNFRLGWLGGQKKEEEYRCKPNCLICKAYQKGQKDAQEKQEKQYSKSKTFVKHIENHLKELKIDGKVVCKICNKDIDEIFAEKLLSKNKGDKSE